MSAGPQLSDWLVRAGALAEELSSRGVLDDPRWAVAVCDTPRHALVPRWYVQDDHARWRPIAHDDPGTAAEWADGVYANAPLVTALEHDEPVSSSSQPSLMLRMLHALDVQDHHRVLEIGTGAGYNAALLAHRLGDRRVWTVDVDAELAERAREALAGIGLHPHVAARDGAGGWPAGAPYDRIVATCSVQRIPWAWVEQLGADGAVLADVKLGAGAGTLALCRRTSDGVAGRFLPKWAAFMPMRTAAPPPPSPVTAGKPVTTGTELTGPLEPTAEFLAALALPGHVLRRTSILDAERRAPVAERYTAGDGSWCEITNAGQARSAGPTPLLDVLTAARRRWDACGRPGWERFGLTVTGAGQRVWLDDPDTDLDRIVF